MPWTEMAKQGLVQMALCAEEHEMKNRYRLYTIIWLAGTLLALRAATFGPSTLAQTITSSTIHLPVIMNPPTPTATPVPTATPAPFRCPRIPLARPVDVPDFPIQLVSVDKRAESAQLRNVSGAAVDLTGWHLCSVFGWQEHLPVGGTFGSLAPGQTVAYANGGGNIWRNDVRDDGALYDAAGQLVSYWVDPE